MPDVGKVNINKWILLTFFVIFYVGFSMSLLLTGIYEGKIKTYVDVIRYINPGEGIHYYNDWLLSSYHQWKETDTIAKTNSLIGIIISSIALLVPFMMLVMFLNAFIYEEKFQGFIIIITIITFTVTILYFLLGGLNAIITIIWEETGIGWKAMEIVATTTTTTTLTTTTLGI